MNAAPSFAPPGLIGQPVSRVDGPAKVTGQARYAAEHRADRLAHGVVISSAIARGRISRIEAAAALAVPGVLQVFTHENRPRTAWFDRTWRDDDAPAGSPFRPLYDAEIHFSAQPVALVVAESFEVARYAATLVEIEYVAEPPTTDLQANRGQAREPKKYTGGRPQPPKERGDFEQALAASKFRVDAEYAVPAEHHNPLECFASTAIWEEDGTLTIYDKTQGVQNAQAYAAGVFSLAKNAVRVRAPYVGGAFGSGLRPQYQLFFAVMAALTLERSVRVSLTRQQMFTLGHRPETLQHFVLGCAEDGGLTAMVHEVIAETSQFEDYVETVSNWSGLLYPCANARFSHQLVPLDFNTPVDMRAPGAAWGVFGIECAMDELAAAAGLDPLEIRLRNYAERDQNEDKPFSSKALMACYRQGAERFGWSRRTPQPCSMREGRKLIGWGMATGSWDAAQQMANARATLTLDGKLRVASATGDIGTGTYTIMTQIAAETLGLPLEDVHFSLGDSDFPTAPLQGGSWTAVTVGSAVKEVCEKIGRQLFEAAQKVPHSPLAQAEPADVEFVRGAIRWRTNPARQVTLAEAMRALGVESIEEETKALPNLLRRKPYSHYAHSAVFIEVQVDKELGKIQVTRAVSAIAGGRILNPKTARSQILGGVVWGIGMALHEETVPDHRYGRYLNHNLAEYHIPAHADIREIDVIFVPEDDPFGNALGAKGLGEIGIVGTAAAVANAIYHATGRRVRRLPVTLDKLL